MTYESEAREAIGDFNDVRELLGNIASRPRLAQRGKGHQLFTDAISTNGLLMARIVSLRGNKKKDIHDVANKHYIQNVRAFHVGTRETANQPWKRHTLNLGQTLTTSDGITGYQIRIPDEFDRPRHSIIVPTLEAVPPALEEVFVRGIGQFCLNSD